MFRYIPLVLILASFVSAQTSSPTPDLFAGCYQVVSLTWHPPDTTVTLIPNQFELQNVPWESKGEFTMHSLRTEAEDHHFENLWTWRPISKNKLEVTWSTGFGGFHGTLKRAANGDLVGTIKEYCDYRCGWNARTGKLRVHPIDCKTN